MSDLQSSDFVWDIATHEEFYFMSHGWDVRKAKEIIAKKPRGVDYMLVSDVAALANLIAHQEENGSALKEPDLSFPTIIVHTPQGNLLLIDGWRRIRKAIKVGEERLLCVVLSKAESKRIKIR